MNKTHERNYSDTYLTTKQNPHESNSQRNRFHFDANSTISEKDNQEDSSDLAGLAIPKPHRLILARGIQLIRTGGKRNSTNSLKEHSFPFHDQSNTQQEKKPPKNAYNHKQKPPSGALLAGSRTRTSLPRTKNADSGTCLRNCTSLSTNNHRSFPNSWEESELPHRRDSDPNSKNGRSG